MSGFDENPFGEPVFNDPFKVNINDITEDFFPYFSDFLFVFRYLICKINNESSLSQDPSIQQVARSTANNNQNLDDYDPFSNNQPAIQPATLQTNQTLPAYSSSGQQYQVNDAATTNGAGSGVTQISTAELQVSHRTILCAQEFSYFDKTQILMFYNFL